jgi:NADH-quinone oxidoreductase subunit M
MFSAVDNFPALLIWIPLFGAILSFLIKKEAMARASAVFFALLSLGVVVSSLIYADPAKYATLNQVSYFWLPGMGSSFSLYLDGISKLLGLLTALIFPMVFLMIPAGRYAHANRFYGLMLLTQCGLMGVFMASDALVFYLFWELALIPVYFLSSIWGGEKRIRATFKFFIYTFAGSLFLLIGILYMYLKTSNGSFSLSAFYGLELTKMEQYWLFFLFFIAFAIKMPVFPFHTWQPEAYEQSPSPVTVVLSAVMVKMGLYGLLRWLLPFFPIAIRNFGFGLVVLIVVGMLYASLLAIKQDSIKKLIAYSSIAHIGLMAAGVFTMKLVALEGLTVQMFNHGINIAALWFVADIVERQTGVSQISQLGGIAKKAPTLTIFFVLAALANIALPLTNAFVGEFMVFNGLFQFSPWIAAIAGLSIVLSAVYTLNMVKNVFFGEVAASAQAFRDLRPLQTGVFLLISIFILVAGVYPKPFFNLIHETVGMIVTRYASI